MKSLIIKYDGLLSFDERERLTEQLKRDIEVNGFLLLDNNFAVYEVEKE